MRTPFLKSLFDRLGPDGVLACSCGGRHRIAPCETIVDEGALERAAALVTRRYGATPTIWVLSDENTEAAAGARWKSLLPGASIGARVLPAEPKPVPSLELVADLAAEVASAAPDLLVAVGGGVVSDLVKRTSLEAGVPNWCIATSPSVDAYSSATASLRVAGYHQAMPALSSEVIVCDLGVLADAPRRLVLAGLGDLLAKFVSYLDWNVSRLVTGETYCAVIADLALGSARAALAAARTLETDPAAAAASLTDAILVSGFAMQAMGGSRPAASAEHTIAHFWETTHAVHREDLELHGILVGAATSLVLAGYRAIYPRLVGAPPSEVDARAALEERLAALAAERPWRERLEASMAPFADKVAAELAGRAYDRAVLSARREAFARERQRIADLALPILDELAAGVALLERLGFPFSLDALDIPDPLRMAPVRNVRLLRARYTTFDLAYELGREEELVAAIAASA